MVRPLDVSPGCTPRSQRVTLPSGTNATIERDCPRVETLRLGQRPPRRAGAAGAAGSRSNATNAAAAEPGFCPAQPSLDPPRDRSKICRFLPLLFVERVITDAGDRLIQIH